MSPPPFICVNIYKHYILQTPTTTAQWQDIVKGFEVRWNFPNCIGALDGKHVRIHCPASSGSLYYNYKGSFSVVMLALVDANYKITYMDVGSEGRVADGGIWRRCSLQQWLKAGALNLPAPKVWPNGGEFGPQPHVIVADDAFPMTTYLMKPHSMRALSKEQRVFNYRLSRARRVSENCFGIMANRFRLLLTNIYKTPDRVVNICKAIAALHNFLRQEGGANYMNAGSVDTEDANHGWVDGEWRRDSHLEIMQRNHTRNSTTEAKALRENMTQYFSTPGGSVPWQDNAIE